MLKPLKMEYIPLIKRHTPGPWKLNPIGVITGGPDGCTSVCTTEEYNWSKQQNEDMCMQSLCNGVLISQAPEMLKTLTECKRLLDFMLKDSVFPVPPSDNWINEVADMIKELNI